MQLEGGRSRIEQLKKAVPWLLFAFALGLRLIGIGWGLKNDLHNASYHPDEPMNFGFSRMIVPGQAKFYPGEGQRIEHFYSYGTLYLTLLRVASDVTTTYTGAPKGPSGGWSWTNPERTDWDWVSRCHLAGRVISALAGAGTVFVVVLLGRRFFGLFGGAMAGLAVAISPGHVVHSRFQTVDILATFFLALSAWYAAKLLPEDGEVPSGKLALKFAGLSGLFAGLSAGTKYTGILALATLFVALIASRLPGAWRGALVGTACAVAAFFVTTPGALFDSANFLQDFLFEMQHSATGHGFVFAGTPSGFLYHLVNLFLGTSLLITLMGLGGLCLASFRRLPWALALLAFFLLYFVLIGRAEVKFLRYTFPLYIGLSLGFGYAMTEARKGGNGGRILIGIGILGIGGIPYGGLRGTAEMTAAMAGTDPRDQAVALLRKDAQPVGLAVDPWFWSPPLFPDAAEPRSVPWQMRQRQMQTQANPPIVYVTGATGEPTSFDIKLLTEHAPPRIAISSFEAVPLSRLVGRRGLPADAKAAAEGYKAFYEKLSADYEIEEVLGSPRPTVEDMEYVNPGISIWKKKNGP